ncbi:MAG: hypothetical protein IT381_15750 [Deltaproteobacteria bacterium]|nr:hypothetical protein [Deltaproteobacteria bacterium]
MTKRGMLILVFGAMIGCGAPGGGSLPNPGGGDSKSSSSSSTSSSGGSSSNGSKPTGGGPSCKGDFSLGETFVKGEDYFEKCNKAAPTNCVDGRWITFKDSGDCFCAVSCSAFKTPLKPGEACDKNGDFTCEKIKATNAGANSATWCVAKSWNVCTEGSASGGGGSSGPSGSTGGGGTGGSSGSTGSTGSTGGGGSGGGGNQCKAIGTKCGDDDECCSKNCMDSKCWDV